jgi:hypothetical protein
VVNALRTSDAETPPEPVPVRVFHGPLLHGLIVQDSAGTWWVVREPWADGPDRVPVWPELREPYTEEQREQAQRLDWFHEITGQRARRYCRAMVTGEHPALIGTARPYALWDGLPGVRAAKGMGADE